MSALSKYKTYPEYKDSDVEWLGEIPIHWELIPCRAIVQNIVEKNENNKDDNYLSLMANIGVIKYEDKGDIGNKKPDDLSKCKVVKKGQLVINSMNYSIGSFGISSYNGICSPVYIVLEARKNILLTNFSERIFGNSPFQKYLSIFGNGILEHRAAINWNDIKTKYVALPPFIEQIKIAQFLDHETAKIDLLIEKQKILIELLEEKRQAVITHAITKGIEPNVKMKKSNIEWIGDIPESWTMCSLQRVITKIEQGSSPIAQNKPPEIGEYGVLKISSVKKGMFFESESKTLDSKVFFEERFQIQLNDVLVTRANTPQLVADVCIVKNIPQFPLMMSDLIYRISLIPTIDKDFFNYYLLSHFGRAQIERDARGSSMSMAKVSQSHIKSWSFLIPTPSEIPKIVSYLNIQTSKIDLLIQKAEEQIELMKERRTALISAAVTGKIDVRDWQPEQ